MTDQEMRAAALQAASRLENMSAADVLHWANYYYEFIRTGTTR